MAKKKTFEEAITRVGEIVKELEGGDITLEESLTMFEEGVALTKTCNSLLDGAQQKVTMLLKNAQGEVQETEYEKGSEK